ncbi:MAG: DUF2569 family protein [Psychroserpens sp.]|uniref:DUF2569 family protein n=1 Tax=Psychroserpens sp. TaxID=2020870 RepID=UPI0030022BBB
MALINCPDCKKEVSSKASSCLHCGFPIQEAINKCPECEVEILLDAETCLQCGFPLMTVSIKTDNRYITEELKEFINEDNNPITTKEDNLEGIEGWLYFIGFIVVVFPLVLIFKALPTYFSMFTDGTWDAITTPGFKSYNPLWGPLIYIEILINIGLLFACILVVYQFFLKKKTFPKWFIGILLFRLVFNFVDELAVITIIPEKTIDASQHIYFLIGMSLIIWYILVSERVKATFVN